MVTTALERLRELRQEGTAEGEEAWTSPSTSCPPGTVGQAEAADWDQPAADVLDVLVKAGAPLLHTALVRGLAGRGYGKAAAYQAIAGCQRRGWIWHNLTTGYELPGEADTLWRGSGDGM